MSLMVQAVLPGWPHRRRGGLMLCVVCGQDKQALALGEQRLGAALLAEPGHEDRDAFLAAKASAPAMRLLTTLKRAYFRWAARFAPTRENADRTSLARRELKLLLLVDTPRSMSAGNCEATCARPRRLGRGQCA